MDDFYNRYEKFGETMAKLRVEGPSDPNHAFPELTRGLKFISYDDIFKLSDKERLSFVLTAFPYMVVSQILHSYFPQHDFYSDARRDQIVLAGHFGMGGAAHVHSPRDFFIKVLGKMDPDARVKDIVLGQVAGELDREFGYVNEFKSMISVGDLYICFFRDEDLKPIDEHSYVADLYSRLYSIVFNHAVG